MQTRATAATGGTRSAMVLCPGHTGNRRFPAPAKIIACLEFFNQILDSLVNNKARDSAGTKTWTKKMSSTKPGALPSDFEGTLQSSSASTAALVTSTHAEIDDDLDNLFKDDTDFDVEDDIAFLSEDYDVMELDDVLELCNVGRDDAFDA